VVSVFIYERYEYAMKEEEGSMDAEKGGEQEKKVCLREDEKKGEP